jgi:hypothetical protein
MKLNKVQKALKTPKDKTNAFGKYKYRNAESILEALKEVMPDDCITRCTIDLVDGVEILKEMFTNGSSYIEAKLPMPPVGPEQHKGMSIEQVYGCRVSYARKYALGMLYAIDDSKDDPDSKDNTNTVPSLSQKPYYKKSF